MKTRIILALTIALSLGSWVNSGEKVQVKVKDSTQKTCPKQSQGAKKQAGKKDGRLLFESVLYHLI